MLADSAGEFGHQVYPIALLLSAEWIQWAEGTGVHKLQKEKDSLRNSLCVNRQTHT